ISGFNERDISIKRANTAGAAGEPPSPNAYAAAIEISELSEFDCSIKRAKAAGDISFLQWLKKQYVLHIIFNQCHLGTHILISLT
ncbi:hypothetical protein QUG40_13475, partial [Enterobacter cloacae]|uniref:hypothetical protein n=1 Tax=Enterobacter cloacae TaxID=550 RepID=UPI0025A1653B